MPEFDLFALLAGASPWWWVALAVIVGVIELLTFSYFLIWVALAALATGVTLWFAPGLGGAAQLALFAALAVVLTVAGRAWLARRRVVDGAPGLNRRSEQMVGRVGKTMAAFERGEGVLLIDGVRWSARLRTGAAGPGETLRVIGAEGMVLICEPA
ncbi:NfeD family protein [Pikeienuella piscinae]|uniref:NfeD family protein n=1 Tax=Pikeienuella piscinae TaxID=2748098 RepID=A0A7L5BSP1_9RHOB|nr:NfeD family protein [Pikeienuella piscinae]QIE54580.1 NfeD family protein [Pikeienuella piscinae]